MATPGGPDLGGATWKHGGGTGGREEPASPLGIVDYCDDVEADLEQDLSWTEGGEHINLEGAETELCLPLSTLGVPVWLQSL